MRYLRGLKVFKGIKSCREIRCVYRDR